MTARIEDNGLTVALYRKIGCAETMIEFPKSEWLYLVAEWNSQQLAERVQSETLADE